MGSAAGGMQATLGRLGVEPTASVTGLEKYLQSHVSPRDTLTGLLEGGIAEFSPCDMSLGLKGQETDYWRWSQEKGLERLEQVPQLWDLVVVSCHTVLVHLDRSPCHHRLEQGM